MKKMKLQGSFICKHSDRILSLNWLSETITGHCESWLPKLPCDHQNCYYLYCSITTTGFKTLLADFALLIQPMRDGFGTYVTMTPNMSLDAFSADQIRLF